jgi:CRISPR type III-B/RAMP module RAMP protein Cmr1
MTIKTYHIEFLTPCFCAGADQTHAELRPSAIRGQLRWWFRCLGGTPEEERTVFGGVHGDNPTASTFAVRVQVQTGTGQRDWYSADRIPKQGTGPRTYLLGFFCGRTGRLQPAGALPPGCKALVQFIFRQPPSDRLQAALRAFFSFGALGFRITRAAGAFASTEHSLSQRTWAERAGELRAAGFTTALLQQEFSNWVDLIDHAGRLLKNNFRSRDGLGISAGSNGTKANALGSAQPRQASALHFRPVRIEGKLRLVLIEAPHSRVLGPQALKAHGNRDPVLQLANLTS